MDCARELVGAANRATKIVSKKMRRYAMTSSLKKREVKVRVVLEMSPYDAGRLILCRLPARRRLPPPFPNYQMSLENASPSGAEGGKRITIIKFNNLPRVAPLGVGSA